MVVQEWRRGIKIKVRAAKGEKKKPAKRGRVSDFSRDSARRLGWAYSQGPWKGMLTLTYPGSVPVEYSEFHRHKKNLLKTLDRNGVKYLWVLEWQRRGVPHLHIWVSQDLSDKICPTKTVRRYLSDKICLTESVRQKLTDGNCPAWRGVMLHWLHLIGESTNQAAFNVAMHEKTYCPWEVRVGNNYAAKYADKREQKGLPVGIEHYGRWWGVSRGVIAPHYQTEVDEETVNTKTGEVIRASSIRRQIHRALRAWFPNRKKHKKNSLTGLTVALMETKKAAILRILSLYLGPDPMETQKTKAPDQHTYGWRADTALARELQRIRESRGGTKNVKNNRYRKGKSREWQDGTTYVGPVGSGKGLLLGCGYPFGNAPR